VIVFTLFFFTPVNPIIYQCVLKPKDGIENSRISDPLKTSLGVAFLIDEKHQSVSPNMTYDVIKMRINQKKGCLK